MKRRVKPTAQLDNTIFSLDIGTRTVVGMVAHQEEGVYRILDYEIIGHPDRAMFDGQIHDIGKVAAVVRQAKERLEARTGMDLRHVAIAAAGRSLKTRRVTVERLLEPMTTVTKDLMDSLEMEGIQEAQSHLEAGPDQIQTQYYCVGYTVIHYYLDDAAIQNPKDHRGSRIKADMIATFLPHIVVDSLYTVVDQVGLEVVNMTLEPIAAINVAIPPKFRLLNLALVDVGAGTSDIAITKDGTITSYAMVSEAGDEITEALAREYLLDFDSAEALKIALSQSESHAFTDIVGIPHQVTTVEVLQRLEPVIRQVTGHIALQILENNGKAPSAVFCIGGGCQVPGFTRLLAEALEMPEDRSVIKGAEALENLHYATEALSGPEYVTPVGIGFTALKDRHQDFLQVMVNDKQIRLFNSRQMSVSDALILIGYHARKLIARRGEPITVTLNGQSRTIPGEFGEPARIEVNGRSASLDTRLKNMDHIHVEPAVPGQPAAPCVREILPLHRVFRWQDREIPMICEVRVNGEPVGSDHILMDGDAVETKELKSLADFLEYHELDLQGATIEINGQLARRSAPLSPGDDIRWIPAEREPSAASDALEPEEEVLYQVVFNGNPMEIRTRKRELIFVDIFDHVSFDRSTAKGILSLNLNGKRASYLDKLKTGDVIDIHWT